jgi:hypothetical protein
MRWKDALVVGAPLGVAAFLVVTARGVVGVVDGPDEALYGFPLFWVKAGPTSLSVIVDVAAAAVDVAVYVAAAWLLTAALGQTRAGATGSRAARFAAWGVGTAVTVACAVVLSSDAAAGGVTFGAGFEWGAVKRYSIYVGVPGRPWVAAAAFVGDRATPGARADEPCGSARGGGA